jgi:hypothetical protein
MCSHGGPRGLSYGRDSVSKLTDEAVTALWRKQSKEMTDEDYLQWIASDLHMFEANAADAVSTMHSIARWALTWVKERVLD